MDSQILTRIGLSFDSVSDTAAKARRFLLELVEKHGLDASDAIFRKWPFCERSEDPKMTDEEIAAFKKPY